MGGGFNWGKGRSIQKGGDEEKNIVKNGLKIHMK